MVQLTIVSAVRHVPEETLLIAVAVVGVGHLVIRSWLCVVYHTRYTRHAAVPFV